eukprot:scaffold2663_cov256-Pinguiococcus_pyrenoidosus.AAC.4
MTSSSSEGVENDAHPFYWSTGRKARLDTGRRTAAVHPRQPWLALGIPSCLRSAKLTTTAV